MLGLVHLMLILLLLASIISTRRSWQNIAEGKAKAEDLYDLTWIFDQAYLEYCFGAPDQHGRYLVTKRQVQAARRPIARLLDSMIGDGFFLALIMTVPIVQSAGSSIAVLYSGVVAFVAGLYTLGGYVMAGYLITKYRNQILDE